MKISILGAGTWGTALSILLAENKHEVTIWSALQKEVTELSEHRTEIKNLPGGLNSRLATSDRKAINFQTYQ